MSNNLKDYMTEEEKKQVDSILETAQERMRAEQISRQDQQFLFLGCQCECYGTMRQNQEGRQKSNFADDIQTLLQQICEFCKRHRACFRKEGEEEREEDDELPF